MAGTEQTVQSTIDFGCKLIRWWVENHRNVALAGAQCKVHNSVTDIF